MMKDKRIKSKVSQLPPVKNLSKGAIQEIWGKDKWKNLFAPVDVSSLVLFRILFGMIMLYEVVRYFQKGWIAAYWIQPTNHFTYWPFDFLAPLPGNGMYILFSVMGILSVMIMVGLFYRVSMLMFCCCFSYMFLLEQTRYMNHFYLIILISFVMIFIPAHTSASLDSRLFKSIRSETAPAWCLWLVRFMIALPYFFGGVAKLNTDWLQGEPLRMWLSHCMFFPVIGPLFQYDWMVLFMAYSGLLLDLLVIPALLFDKTRKWGFLLIVLFHLLNSELFNIGIFPWFMIASTTLYFSPDWPRKAVNLFTGNSWPLIPGGKAEFTIQQPLGSGQKMTISALSVWALLHIVLPVRHFFIPGVVHWTEEGHRYAWHMKLRSKNAVGAYTVQDKKSGVREGVDVKKYLTSRQIRKLNDKPYLIWQFCQMIKEDYRERGADVAVYANIQASLNGRKYQALVDSTVDISSMPRPLMKASWIVPLQTPLSERLADNEGIEDGGE